VPEREQGPDAREAGNASELPCSYSQAERRYNPTGHHSRYVQGSTRTEDQSSAAPTSSLPQREQFPPQEVMTRLLQPSRLAGEALPPTPPTEQFDVAY